MRILEYCVRISLQILTTDPRPRPRPQADAVSDPLSVRESLFDSDPCLHLTSRPRGLSTLPCVLGRIYRGHNSKAMIPTAVSRSRQKQQCKVMNNQQLAFKSCFMGENLKTGTFRSPLIYYCFRSILVIFFCRVLQ